MRIIPPSVEWELIVVNNNCMDSTDQVLSSFASRLPLRRIFEPESGISNARNAAVRNATGEYIIWTDDDVLVDKEWLVAYEQAFREWPEASIFGGPIKPWFEGTPPSWLSIVWKEVSNAYGIRDFGSESINLDLENKIIPFGANFSIKLNEQRKFFYDPNLGRKMQHGTLGEETEVIRAILSSGHSGRWVPKASLQHWIPSEKQTLNYLKSYWRLHGRHLAKGFKEESVTLLFGRPRWLWRKAIEAEITYYISRLNRDPRCWIKSLMQASVYWGALSEWL